MAWMEWITPRHALFTSIPVAVALLLPWPLIAAQRPGRGIRPWWTTCRYLCWAGVIGGVLAAIIGMLHARSVGLLPSSALLAPRGTGFLAMLFRQHQLYSAISLVLGVLCLRSVFRKRQDYQGIGVLSLFLGLLWSAASIMAVYRGDQVLQAMAVPIAKAEKEVAAPLPVAPVRAKDESTLPSRALDYLSLTPMHTDPVRSMPHGNRWIRVWANDQAVEAYRQGTALPEGAFVVMSSVESRWGRPGPEPGPLYALEIKSGGKPSLSFYWPRVPEARRNETRGADRVYWHDDAPELQACLACHAEGAAPAKDRSRWMATSSSKGKTAAVGE